jgi:diguanylate cyclase (GGDEF)-like protein
MISWKRYLDLDANPCANKGESRASISDGALASALRRIISELAECGAQAYPDLGSELTHGVARILEALGPAPAADAIVSSEMALRDVLRRWAKNTIRNHDRKAEEVRDLLLVMTRTAESLSHRDDQYARQLDEVTSQLESIASLEDVSRIRASIEGSARELKNSIARMAAETKAVIDHLRVEVCTYQAKLEKAEHIASIDSLTGLGSRRWIEGRIQQRIESGTPFALGLIDIDEFSRVISEYGNLVGDLLLKEFARELRSSCRFTDVLGRWGGDEFIVVMDHAEPEIEAQFSRMRNWISKPYHVPGKTGYVKVKLEVSVGLAVFRRGEQLQEVLERADAELCLQRGSGKKLMTA